MPEIQYFILCISRRSLDNWRVCKEKHLFGVSSRRRGALMVQPGDKFVLQLGGQGFKAHGEITSEAQQFSRDTPSPWRDGRPYPVRFSINVVREYERPKSYYFPNKWNSEIRIHILKHLRPGFSQIEKWQFDKIVADLETLNAGPIEEPIPASHDRAQSMLITLGKAVRCDVAVSRDTRGRSYRGESFRDKTLEELPRLGFDEETTRLIERIDLLWLQRNSIVCAFEIEHSTQVYSGLLRLADLVALQPNIRINLYVVADAPRKDKVVRELNRPTFASLRRPLAHLCKFISYQSLESTVDRAEAFAGRLDVEIINDIAENCRL